MKKIFIFWVLIALINLSAQAKTDKIGPKALANIERIVDKMSEVMNLNEQQKAKILELKKVVWVKQSKLVEQYKKGTDEFNAAKKDLNRSFNVMLKKVCTKEQIKTWTDYKKAN